MHAAEQGIHANFIIAYNILMTPVTPEPRRGIGGNGRRPGQGLNLPKRRDVAQTSPPK
jgi:hypothetical protein